MPNKPHSSGRRFWRAAAIVSLLVSGSVGAEAARVEVRLAGSSAHAPALLSLLRLTAASGFELCRPGSLHVYSPARTEQAGLEMLYRCIAGRDAGQPPGATLALAVTSRGGAGAGLGALVRGPHVQPADGTRLDLAFLSPDDHSLLATPSVPKSEAGVLAAYQFHGGVPPSARRLEVAPDLVLADLEPAQFARSLRPALSAAEQQALAALPIASVIHGVPLSRGLWQRLQALEFPEKSACNPHHPDYGSLGAPNSPANSLACTPSLSKAQAQGLLDGRLQDWRDLQSTLQPGADAASVAVAGLPPLLSSEVYLERREATSGTQRAFETYFHPGRCGEAGLAGAGSKRVHVNASDAELVQRLARHDTEGRAAIGLLPTTVAARAADRWRFVKISGTPPDLRAAATGRWELWFEGSLHFRRAPVGGLAPAALELQAFALALARGLGRPSVLRHLNTSYRQFTGPAGLMARAGGPPPTAKTDANDPGADPYQRPVALVSRMGDGTPDACASPVAVGKTPVSAP